MENEASNKIGTWVSKVSTGRQLGKQLARISQNNVPVSALIDSSPELTSINNVYPWFTPFLSQLRDERLLGYTTRPVPTPIRALTTPEAIRAAKALGLCVRDSFTAGSAVDLWLEQVSHAEVGGLFFLLQPILDHTLASWT